MTVHVPAGLPLLQQGAGESPEDGGCLIQVASYLHDGQSWTDSTPCVHPILRSAAIRVNDYVSDAYRPLLAPLAADLVGTGPGPEGLPGRVLSVRLATWVAEQVAHLQRAEDQAGAAEAVRAAKAWADCPCKRHSIAADIAAHATPDAYAASAAAHAVNYSTDLISSGAARSAVADIGTDGDAATRDELLGKFLRDLIAEHRRLTDVEAPDTGDRWTRVCDLIGTTR